jgi:hypothetical protein
LWHFDVSVTENNYPAACSTGAVISGLDRAQAFRRAEYTDNAVILQAAGTTIRGTIVYHDDLGVRRQCGKQAIDGPTQVYALIVTDDDYAHRAVRQFGILPFSANNECDTPLAVPCWLTLAKNPRPMTRK